MKQVVLAAVLAFAFVGTVEGKQSSGRGPFENYIDRKDAAFVGCYDSTVTDQYVDYVRPQDCGYKSDVRWVAFADESGKGVRFSADVPLFVQALHYSREDLLQARHWRDERRRYAEMIPSREVLLNLDVRQLGLGNAGCGPRPLDEYRFAAEPVEWTLEIEPFEEPVKLLGDWESGDRSAN